MYFPRQPKDLTNNVLYYALSFGHIGRVFVQMHNNNAYYSRVPLKKTIKIYSNVLLKFEQRDCLQLLWFVLTVFNMIQFTVYLL